MAANSTVKKVPKFVNVGPITYTITFDHEACYEYDWAGVCINRSRSIKLDSRQSDTELPQTLLHEVLHAVGAVWEIEDLDRHRFDDKQKCTDKINLIATALLQLIRSNPELIKFLSEQR